MLSNSEVAAIRDRFSIFRRHVYLNSCSQGALSDSVQSGIQALLESWNTYGSPWDTWTEQYEIARGEFAKFINADPDEVAVVTSVSAAISSVATALDFSDRNTVVMGEFEFPTMGHVWLAQQRRGAVVKWVEGRDNRISPQAYAAAIDRRTLIVPVTGVCFMNGFRPDVREISRLAHAEGALAMLDDYQDCGTRPVDVKAMDVDFYTSGTLKYMLGHAGLAFLYVRKSLIESFSPAVSGWFAQSNPFAFDPKTFDPSPTARRFETGTPPILAIYAALAGMRLLREIGMENIAAHIAKLTQALLEGARAMGVRTKTPADSAGPLVVIQSTDAAALVNELARESVIGSSRHDGLRISFHVYNTLDDVSTVLKILERNIHLLVREEDSAAVTR